MRSQLLPLRRSIGAGIFLVLTGGCAGKQAPVESVDLQAPPMLPAPLAPRYAVGPGEPKDVLVRQVLADAGRGEALPWDEALSGAAAGLVLDPVRPLALERARWAAIRAGYPHPVVALSVGEVTAGQDPEGLADQLAELVSPGQHLGLVRARVQSNRDLWLALVGAPVALVNDFDRELPLGGTLNVALEGEEGGTWIAVAPSSAVEMGDLPMQVSLQEAGEWWLELRTASGQVAISVPIFVDMPTPTAPLLDLPGTLADGPKAALDEATELLNHARAAFDLIAVTRDSALDTLAALPLEQVLAGTWDRETAEARLQGAGFVGGPASQVNCRGSTVSTCLDGLLSSAEGRSILLHPNFRVAGGAALVRTDGVTLVLSLASE